MKLKEKGILKFKGTESKGAMHHLIYQGKKVSITMGDSRKVKHIKKYGSIAIAPNLLSRKFEDMKVTIIDEKNYTKELFDHMTSIKHNHYKEYNENMVVLEYSV